MNKLLFVFILIIWSRILFCQNVVVNEFLASNSTVVADPSGEFDDWIEFYNNSSAPIDMSGWFLSDELDIPDKWEFPDTTLDASEFLIIWADNDEEQGNNHTNFKLSASGESLILSDAGLNPIDQISFGTQTTDISTGRYPNGTGDFIQMHPSFMTENTDDYLPGNDPSEILFDANIVHKYDLQFYVENWADSLEYYYYNGEEYYPAQLTYNDSIVLDSIGVRYKGNSSFVQSSTTPKKPLKFRFDKYKDDQLLYGVSKLNFSNCVQDPTFMREVISYQIAGQYVPSSRTAYTNILVDGDLLGFYVQIEQVDEYFINRNYGDSIGNLFKASDDGATMLYRGSEQTAYEDEYELKTNEEENDWNDLIEMIDNLNNCSSSSFLSIMENYLELDGCASMLAFNMVLSNFDSYTGSGRNFYLYHDIASDQFKFLPWDLNESFGCYSNNWDVIEQNLLDISNLAERPLNQRFLENESLRQLYLEYIEQMIDGPASYDSICNKTEELQDFIDSYVQSDPNKLYSYQDFLQNIEEDVSLGIGQVVPGLKSFSQLRNAAILQQFSGESVFPGDCDNNGIVDEYDILPIGIYFLETGTARTEVSFFWQEYYTTCWYNHAATYADANGDGIVDEKDVIGIGVNWGNTHSITGSSYSINTEDKLLLEMHRDDFEQINNSFSGNGESFSRIKALLETIFGFENTALPNFALLPNYPNPFNPATIISFQLAKEGKVKLTIFNILGQKIRTLITEDMPSGKHSITWNGKDDNNEEAACGIYFYRLKAGKLQKVRKMILMK